MARSVYTYQSLSTYARRVKKLGSGTYGKVYLCNTFGERKDVAVKRIQSLQSEGVQESAFREIVLMQTIKDPNVCPILDILYDPPYVSLALPLATAGTLKTLREEKKITDDGVMRKILYQMARAVYACEINNVLHRDIKTDNFLVDPDAQLGYRVQLADFGISRGSVCSIIPNEKMSSEVYTLWYRPPEIILGNQKYDEKADIWALGCSMAEMLTADYLFAGNGEEGVLQLMYRMLGPISTTSWPEALDYGDWKMYREVVKKEEKREFATDKKLAELITDPTALDLISKMLEYHPHRRANIYEVLSHRYFDQVREDVQKVLGVSPPEPVSVMTKLRNKILRISSDSRNCGCDPRYGPDWFAATGEGSGDEWIKLIYDIKHKFTLRTKTIDHAVHLLGILSVLTHIDDFRYSTVACVHIASMYNEMYALEINEYDSFVDDIENLGKTVRKILKQLDFKINVSTPCDFLTHLFRDGYDDKVKNLAKLTLMLSHLRPQDAIFLMSPDVVAQACLLIACRALEHDYLLSSDIVVSRVADVIVESINRYQPGNPSVDAVINTFVSITAAEIYALYKKNSVHVKKTESEDEN